MLSVPVVKYYVNKWQIERVHIHGKLLSKWNLDLFSEETKQYLRMITSKVFANQVAFMVKDLLLCIRKDLFREPVYYLVWNRWLLLSRRNEYLGSIVIWAISDQSGHFLIFWISLSCLGLFTNPLFLKTKNILWNR